MEKKNAHLIPQDKAGDAGQAEQIIARPITPRATRLLKALLERSRSREEVDRIAGASNGPQEVLRLRRCGLQIPCAIHPRMDRDGRHPQRGVYALAPSDVHLVEQMLSGGAAS